jgi:Ca2+/Na+ antiporter
MDLPLLELIIYVVAGLGAVLLGYGVFLEKETRQDMVFMIASACLLVYALWVENRIFEIAFGVFFVASLVEFIEIMVHYHKQTSK